MAFSFLRAPWRTPWAVLPALLSCLCGPMCVYAHAEPSSLIVSTTSDVVADDGQTSLREAIAYVNSGNAGADPTITFGVSGTLNVTGGEFTLSHNVTIEGGTNATVLDAAKRSRLFNVTAGVATLSDLILTNGRTSGSRGQEGSTAGAAGKPGSDASGGAILNAGTLNLTRITMSNNNVIGGKGGDGASGPMDFSLGFPKVIGPAGPGADGGNAKGGAIYNTGILNISRSTFLSNSATGGAGGSGGYGIATGDPSRPGAKPFYKPSGGGGDGGDGYGGAIFNSGSLHIESPIYQNNSATGGQGGSKGLYSSLADGVNGTGKGPNVYGGPVTAVDTNITAAVNRYLNANLVATADSTLTYSLVSGTLPSGLTLNTATGALSGTPTVRVEGKTAQFKVNDGTKDSNVATVTFNIRDAEASSLVVTTTEDITNSVDNMTSLREAITYANSGTAGASPVITFAPDVTGRLTVTGGQFTLSRKVTIEGGTNGIVLTPYQNSRIFDIPGAINVTLRNLTLQNGYVLADNGSAINADGGAALTLQNCAFSNNLAAASDGLNGGNGGAIYCYAGATLTVQNCIFANNEASSFGGAIFNGKSTSLIQNSTFWGNTASVGGALGNDFYGTLTLQNCTLTNNSAVTGGGINSYDILTLRNTIVAGNNYFSNGSSPDIHYSYGHYTADSDNIVGGTATAAGLEVDSNGTAVLKDNGGPTQTIALVAGGLAINKGNNAYAPGSTDQRGPGYRRISAKTIDCGAYELQTGSPPSISDIAKAMYEDTSLAFTTTDFTSAFSSPGGEGLTRLRITDLPSHGTLKLGTTAVVPDQEIAVADVGTFSYSPEPNFSGSDAFSYTASNASAFATAPARVNLTVTPVNDAPTLDAISNRILPDGASTQSVNLSGISAGGGESQPLTLSASSDNPALIPNPDITYSSPNATGTLSFTPVAGQSGSATLTVTVQDDGGATNGGVDATTRKFLVSVLPNTPPSISNIADQSTRENTPTEAISFTVGDAETSSDVLQITASSSNTALVALEGITLGGSGANRTIRLTPVPNASGQTTLTLAVTDNGGLSSSTSFVLTVSPLSDAPTISSVAPQSISEDAATGDISFTLGDDETPAGNLQVTASSSNPLLISASGITLGGSGSTRTVRLAPLPNASGQTTITLTVTDDSGLSTSTSFVLTVTPVNDAPSVSGLADTTTNEDTPLGPLVLRVGDSETAADALQVSAFSSNPALVPNAALTLGGSGGERTLSLTPARNAFGKTTITITVRDADGASITSSFVLSVTPINDAPVATGQALTGAIGQEIALTLAATDVDDAVLIYEIVSFSGDGTLGGGRLSGTAPNLTFTSFTPGTYTLIFRARDAVGAFSNTATVTFTIGQVSGLTVSGQVLSSEPNASYNASTSVAMRNALVRMESGGRVVAQTATDSAGRYTFYGVTSSDALTKDAQVRVIAIDPQGNGQTQPLPFVLLQLLKLKVSKKQPLPAQVTVAPFTLYSIWGQVNAKSADKKVKTLTPMPSASVQLGKSASATYAAVSSGTTTDANGFYVFKYLGRARFSISAQAAGVTFAKSGAGVTLPGTKRPLAPSARFDITGTRGASAKGMNASSVTSS